MKKLFKNIFIRILFTMLVIFMIFIIVFYLLPKLTKTSENYDNWYKEDVLINDMNTEKLQNKHWGDYPLWIHEGQQLLPKKEGTKRILIIGDSYIWGHGYSNANHLWWQQFKHLLKIEGYDNVEVVAAGLSGYSTEQEFKNIIQNKNFIDQVKPDCIALCYVTNDVELRDENGNYLIELNGNEDIFKNIDNKYVNFIKYNFPSVYYSISAAAFHKYGHNKTFQEKFGYNYTNWFGIQSEGKYIEDYENNIIKPMKEYIDNNFNIPFFVYMPSSNGRKYDINIDNVINVFQKNGFKFYYSHDIIGNEILKFGRNQKINPVNEHPSVFMCKKFAEQFLMLMESEYPEILGEKNGIYEAKLNINDWMPYKINLSKINENTYKFRYPAIDEENAFLSMPVNKNYIKLNLEDPLNMQEIVLEIEDEENVKDVEIWINTIDKKAGYDKQEMKSLGIKTENYAWKVDSSLQVTSINVNINTVDGQEKEVNITIY